MNTKPSILTIAILSVLMFAATPGFAQVILDNNPNLTLVRAQSAQNQCAGIHGQESNVPDSRERLFGQNVDCLIEPLNVRVNVGPEGGAIRICYAIYGNAMTRRHDGAVAWVDGPNGTKLADYALAPSALDTFTDSTTISSCADAELTGPQSFVIQVHAAWDTAGPGFREQWGGDSPKTGVPSHLTVDIVDILR